MNDTIKKYDTVTLNNNYTSYYGAVIAAGTKCKVWKVKRDGTLSLSPVDGFTSITLAKSYVTKVATPKANVKVGDIFTSSWGYEQTNIDFYEVVEVLPNSVKFVALGESRNYTGPMCGECVPTAERVGPVQTARIRVDNNGDVSFKVRSFANAYPWKGTPCFFSEWH